MIYLIFRNEIQGCEFYNLKAYFLKQYIILRKLSPEKKKKDLDGVGWKSKTTHTLFDFVQADCCPLNC